MLFNSQVILLEERLQMIKTKHKNIFRKLLNGNKVNLLICMFVIISLSQFCNATDWIRDNIEFTINGKFESALDLLNERVMKYPDDYQTYFYLAATLNSKMTHFEYFKDEQNFNNYIDKTIQLIEPKLENEIIEDTLHSKLLFFLGSAYGYRGYFEGRKGNWYSALSNGLKAKSLLSESIELDSTYVEAYLGIGTYKYWLSSKIKFVLWIPFVPDDREEGIEMIKKSLEIDSPVKYMAMHQLVYILIDYGNFEEAIDYAERIIKKYPESQFMWWANAHTYYKKRDYDKAISSYNQLLTLFENDPNHNPGHFIKCNLKLAQLYYELNNYPMCNYYSKVILAEMNNNSLYEKYNKEFEEAEEYFTYSNEQVNSSVKNDDD